MGCNMCFRRDVIERAGGFYDGLGRTGNDGFGCSETEFCIRARRLLGGRFVFEPAARIHHRVPQGRTTWRYFAARCRAEGRSKAHLADREGQDEALALEKTYVRRTLPDGRGPRPARRHPAGRCRARPFDGHRRRRRPDGDRLRGGHRHPSPTGVSAAMPTRFEASRVVVVDVDQPLPELLLADPGGRWHGRARLLVRWAGRPVAVTDLDLAADLGPVPRSPTPCGPPWARSWPSGSRPAPAVGPTHLTADGLPSPDETFAGPTASATVVIATRDRPTSLARCLDRILALDHPDFDVVVVDNAPSD